MFKREYGGKVLTVERYDYGFRFYFGNAKKSWFIKTDPIHKGAVLITEELNREAKKQYGDTFVNLGAKNICGLFIKLILQPEETLYGVLGERYAISKVVVYDYTEKAYDGFEECTFSDLITPQDLLNA